MTAATADSVTLDASTRPALVRRTDHVGVLSVHVDARPSRTGAASIEIKSRLAEGSSGDCLHLAIG